ncbi:DUF1707 domain-containing protein [Nocardioides sp. SYSU D00065]|uniref:DUF1707 SHOCT-like domain-containing protein n=1 Tax=Nocardioides sp. SYSU D00065 TaxID=2817378 RepID=UPI001B33154B|nr:DUF1707 domain-containing protein [Nocardioides sp. SYSU D00065]
MARFRARDADRDRHVEVIEAAYVDGQIGDADRELRVSRALSAATLDELEALTRDLQRRPGAPVPAAPDRARTPGRLGGVLGALGAAAALIVAGAVALVVLASTGEGSGDPFSSADPARPRPAPQAGTQSRGFEMTAPAVRRLLHGYASTFGTLDAFEAVFYPSRASFQVPAAGTRSRKERWSYDGGWRQDTPATRTIGAEVPVDLGELDVRRLFDNIATARDTLGVPHGRLTHVLVNVSTEGTPTVSIYIANRAGTGLLRTTLSGDLVRAHPYDG